MGNEVLTDGKVIVERPDTAELIDIRQGKCNIHEIFGWVENSLNTLRLCEAVSPLPAKPNFELAEQILVQTIKEAFKNKFQTL